MRKSMILCLIICISIIMCNLNVIATTDYTNGTVIEFVGQGSQEYVVTVPAVLKPGQSGTVTLSGTWASNYTVEVTADETVVLINSINNKDTQSLNILFNGIKKSGNNFGEQTYTEPISVTEMPKNILFGTWSGTFYYNVRLIPFVGRINQPYVRTYLIKGIDDEVCPSSVILNDDRSAIVQIGDTTEIVPANLFVILGDEIDIGDETLDVLISEDGTKISLINVNPELLIAEWTLKSES